jgi:ligand-binding sensor domain-containing protein
MKVCIAEDDAGNLWFGTLQQGLYCYTPSTGKYISFPLPGLYNNIWSLYYENNELLIGARGGLARFSTTTKKFRSLKQEVPKAVQELTDCPTTSILKDNSGSFWIALYPYGLIKYNFTSKEYIHYTAVDPIYACQGKERFQQQPWIIAGDFGLDLMMGMFVLSIQRIIQSII